MTKVDAKDTLTTEEAKNMLAQEKKARENEAAKAFEKLCQEYNVIVHIVETKVDGKLAGITISFTAND